MSLLLREIRFSLLKKPRVPQSRLHTGSKQGVYSPTVVKLCLVYIVLTALCWGGFR